MMIKISLKQITTPEFEALKKGITKSYAKDIAESFGLPFQEALHRSKKQMDDLLEDGLETNNQYFLSIFENNLGEKIGHIWFEQEDEQKNVFLYHLETFEDYRNKGFGKAAFVQFENHLKSLNINRIRLNVFEKNTIARLLYKNQGFHITNVMMQKNL